MGCQKEIIGAIRDKKADYIVAAKENHGGLLEAIGDTVLLERPVETAVEEDCGHGHVEKRTYHKATEKTVRKTRYYISNLDADAARLNRMVREHWSVENNLHWVLDVVFGEDYARKRAGGSAENFNLVLEMALLLVNNEKSFKKGKNNKRLRALLDREYREKLLFFKCFCPALMKGCTTNFPLGRFFAHFRNPVPLPAFVYGP